MWSPYDSLTRYTYVHADRYIVQLVNKRNLNKKIATERSKGGEGVMAAGPERGRFHDSGRNMIETNTRGEKTGNTPKKKGKGKAAANQKRERAEKAGN